MLADCTVKMTGIVKPMSAAGGSKATWPGIAERSESSVQVALLLRMLSVGLRRKGRSEMTVFELAGIVIAVILGGIPVDVAVALAELGPITVTRTSTVYMTPLPADCTVNITGRVKPISTAGGSKVTWSRPEIVTQVALLDRISSAALLRYAAKDRTVFWPAGIVIAVILGATLDEVGEAIAEVGPITVTSSATVYVVPLLAD